MPIASIEGGDLCKVWEIKTLGLSGDAEARKLLEDVAKQVQPIMRKRKWKVPLLSEFCPSNPSLLGLNIDGGREIRIRLRRNRHDSRLFPFEATLGTMLHELTHIQCGPHNAAFYKLLDELTKECEDLIVKGITGTGQGFDTRGQRLGGITHNPPSSRSREVALAAAEKRAKLNSIMTTGPRRLGGDDDIMRALTPVQAAAMAAERRLRDDFWCAAPLTQGEDGMSIAREREECVSGTAGLPGSSGTLTREDAQGVDENLVVSLLDDSDGPTVSSPPPSRPSWRRRVDDSARDTGSVPKENSQPPSRQSNSSERNNGKDKLQSEANSGAKGQFGHAQRENVHSNIGGHERSVEGRNDQGSTPVPGL